ncbi:Coiled-coil and C2 domain-containing protein 2A-like protein [Dinothrombium tinctorium]|uniref:Coiled-coil and C2 domain-containing protein 2A-like protein n=1 Tax=Dinothrombium tinctorium TaxID=1965070 RepID=A0A3S3SFD3_9ACAR|nr:Coiled-coil and C2 domain-containing protein 2A-like protein [Dinothrombium tinctorium]RWS13336.1 Coiled-coil and C2 domain-containing protein 2A-like protein [Dinothrombium tinctorium]
MTDSIYLNLFDEVVVNRDDSKTDAIERRWLGSLRIPFSTLYLNSKIDGTFCLNKPPVLLGYEYDSKFWNLGSNNVNSASTANTYLTIFLTIDPTLQLPEPLSLKCDSNEDEEVLQYAQKWETEMAQNFKDRSFKALAIDLNAKFVLVTRYLKPIKPPEELLYNLSATEEVMQRLARFVSLIPIVSDNMALPGFGDIWCNSSEFLEMLIGDEEEHAILLCNFFLYLGKRAGIVLGNGIPEGMTAYVIVWEYTGQEPSVWNPCTGVKLEKKIEKLQQTDLIQDLEDILIVHQMTGFPLNMPFVDLQSVTEAVYATGVHLVDDKKVDFALAVYIHPYPCNVLSLWVYIAALHKI